MYYHQRTIEENNFPKALGISAIIMAALIGLAFLVVFNSDLPQYGMGGIIVNYGTSDEGMGDDYMSVSEPSMDEDANMVRPDRINPQEQVQATPSQQTSDQAVATQDMEEAPAVEKAEKPVEKVAAESTPKKEESTPAVNPNALFKGKKNNAEGQGDGTGSVAGNQGSALGDPLASNYGEGGSGDGDMMLSLKDRRFVVRPNIEDKGQQSGRVAVEFRVNRRGVITYARAGVRGTTLSDRALLEKCEKAVLGARLNELPNAPATQTGVLVFNFKLK